MPSLDMSDGLLEPVFQDYAAVIRRQQIITNKGRAIIKPCRFQQVMMVVTSAAPNDLERLGDYQYQGSALSIVTKFKLRGIARDNIAGGIDSAGQPNPQYQPDIIFWGGDYFLVVTVNDYSRYGSGFIQAIAVSHDFVDDAPGPDMKVQSFDFSNASNSGLIPILQQG